MVGQVVTRKIDPNDTQRVYVTFGGFSAGNIWSTSDGGASWNDLSTWLPPAPVKTIQVWKRNSAWLYIGTEIGVFASNDTGATWSPSNEGPANVSVDDARTLAVTPWDKSMVQVIEKAILTSDLGLNPSTAGQVIRIPLPPLTEERRRDLIKVVGHESEHAKVAIRNVRRDANHKMKELQKNKELSEDDERRAEDEIQRLTDKYVAEVDEVAKVKEAELLEV